MLERASEGTHRTVRATINHTQTQTEIWEELTKVAARSTSINGAILIFWVEYPACIGLIYPCGHFLSVLEIEMGKEGG